MLIDSHCHIHDVDYTIPAEEVLVNAAANGVNKIVTMSGEMTDLDSAVEYVRANDPLRDGVNLYAFLGVHPSEAAQLPRDFDQIVKNKIQSNRDIVKGVGEIGLDYFYDFANHDLQIAALERQLQLAVDLDLPVSMHIRSGKGGDAFADLIPLLDNFSGRVRGAVHSFTDTVANLEKVLERGLSIGVNGIVTFNKDPELDRAYRVMPLDRIILETDAPWLAPKPYRGRPNQPSRIREIAEFLAVMKGVSFEAVAQQTTSNVLSLYKI